MASRLLRDAASFMLFLGPRRFASRRRRPSWRPVQGAVGSRALAKEGLATESFEIERDPAEDIMTRAASTTLRRRLRLGLVIGLAGPHVRLVEPRAPRQAGWSRLTAAAARR